MKRYVSFLLAVCLMTAVIMAAPFDAYAAGDDISPSGATSGVAGSCTWTFDDDGVLTVSGSGAIPDYEYDGAPWYKLKYTSIVIGEGITGVGEYAFHDYYSGAAVLSLPDSLVTISDHAFDSCGISSLVIPDGVQSIGYRSFGFCRNLKSVFIGSGVAEIDTRAFYACNSMVEMRVSEDNPVFDSRDNCNAVIETETDTLHSGFPCSSIPKSVTAIGNAAFGRGLEYSLVMIPEGITSIGIGAFVGSRYFQKVIIPSSCKIISERAFDDCDGIRDLIIRDGVSRIEAGAFVNCDYLRNVTIPDSVTYIGEKAFGYNGDNRISDFTICGSRGSAAEAYAESAGITFVESDGQPAEEDPFEYLTYSIVDDHVVINDCAGFAGDLVIPDEIGGYPVTHIRYGAFRERSDIRTVTLPDTLTDIGYEAFYRCLGLRTIDIPDSVTHVGEDVFYDCSLLSDVHLGSGLTVIPRYTFLRCSSLTEIFIPEGVTEISAGAFGETGITNLTLPKTLVSIGSGAFRGCESLSTAYISDSVTEIDSTAFDNCPELMIICGENSAASRYAAANGIAYIEIPVAQQYAAGDVDMDGEVTILDATRIQRYLVELCSLSGGEYEEAYEDDPSFLLADVDLNGRVSIFDALRICRYLAGLCLLDGTPIAQ